MTHPVATLRTQAPSTQPDFTSPHQRGLPFCRYLGRRAGRTPVVLFVLLATLVLPQAAAARDTFDQLSSRMLHVGFGPGFDNGATGIGGHLTFAFPLEGLPRAAHFEMGVAGLGYDGAAQVTIPLMFRYSFLTGSPFVPYLGAGIGYYLYITDAATDHGFQLLNALGGLSYFVTESTAVGIGGEVHSGSISVRPEDPKFERTWYTLNLRATFVY